MSRVCVPAVKRAGIQDFRWDDIRHTFASQLVKGVDIRMTHELLGHADIRMTLRYSPLSPSHLLDAVEKLPDRTGTSESASEEHDVVEPEQRGVTEEPREPPAGVEPATY